LPLFFMTTAELKKQKKLIEQSFEKVPKHSLFRLHRLLGEYLNMERQYEKAYKEFEAAIKLAPQGDTPAVNASISELYLLSGDVLFELKQYDKSEEVLGKAREYAEKTRQGGDIALADEKLTDYYVTMAALSMRKKDMDKADKYLKEAESIKSPDLKESNVGDVANIRAEWLMKKGKYKEAVDVLSAMAGKSTESPDGIYIRMAAAYSGMKDKTNTVKSLKKALQVGSNKRKIATIIKTYEEFGNTINDPELQALLK